MKKLKVIICDDHAIFRNGLRLLLERVENLEVVGEASNGKEFIELVAQRDADIAFIDISMPQMDGIEATEKAMSIKPSLKIIALTTYDDDDFIKNMLLAGAEGYMLKNSSIEEFRRAIQKVSKGDCYFSDKPLLSLTKNIMAERKHKDIAKQLPKLSKREQEVLELICQGHSNFKIGEMLNISDRTVERHKTNLLNKTDTNNTVNLVIYAFRNKLVKITD